MNRPARILITEDEGLVAADLESRLRNLGYSVLEIADTAARSVAIATRCRPDLILMDVHLAGGSDGIEAAVEIHRTLALPIVFLTAYADSSTLERAAAAAPFGYIVKPFEERALAAAVQMALARHEAELKVRRMEQWLATTFRSIGDAVISVDGVGLISYLNPEAERLTGWIRSDAIGRHFREVLRFSSEELDQPLPSHPLAEAMESGLVIHLAADTDLITRSGTRVAVDDSAAPIRDEQDRIEGAVMVLRDRSRQKQDTEERRKIERKMQEAQRFESLGVLAGGIAHDFNNLLAITTMNAEIVLGTGSPSEETRSALADILAAAKRGAALCRQMLAYAGNEVRAETVFNLSELVESTAALLGVAMGKNVQLRLSLNRALPSSKGDTTQIQQVIMNLLINASESLDGKEGTIRLETSVFQADQSTLSNSLVGSELTPGDYLSLSVTDTGCGMPPEVQARIFDPFYTTKFTGRGLGLAAVLGIVRSHKGTIFVTSAPGLGTTFRVLLPIAHRELAPLKIVEPPPASARWKSHGTLLLVDDEPRVRAAGALLLQMYGFKVIVACDGEDALQKLEEAKGDFRLMITDLTMPGLNGLDLTRRAVELYPQLRVVVMSGFSSESTAGRFANLPISAFLQKPFTAVDLEATVREALGEK